MAVHAVILHICDKKMYGFLQLKTDAQPLKPLEDRPRWGQMKAVFDGICVVHCKINDFCFHGTSCMPIDELDR